MTQFNPDACRLLPPADDPYLEACFVAPPILPALLCKRSTIVAAPAGYGKSALAYMAQRALDTECLNVTLIPPSTMGEDAHTHWAHVMRAIIEGAWARVEAQPILLGQMGTRAQALKYFAAEQFGTGLLNYRLDRLAEDCPEHVDAINVFRELPGVDLFGPNAYLDQKLRVLCDAVNKLGTLSVMIWIDLPAYQAQQQELNFLYALFDSVSQMRAQNMHIKCLVDAPLAATLENARGVRTLSAERLDISWTTEDLIEMAHRRLCAATHDPEVSLDRWMNPQDAHTFLAEYSDPGSPREWTALTHALIQHSNHAGEIMPLSDRTWMAVRRAYCAERVKIHMDSEGTFWRGTQKLSGLTRRKGAIYPLVRYLYEHPGYHKSYRLETALNMKTDTFDTTLSRARHEHIEPKFGAAKTEGSEWIYLVTSPRGEGVALIHTDRSP